MTVERVIPPPEAVERRMLAAWLDLQRATLVVKCDGLTDAQLRDQAVPPPTLSLLGLARHILSSPPEAWRDGCHRLMEDACTTAGVRLGASDHRNLLWLAGWEPSTCARFAGLIRRAGAL